MKKKIEIVGAGLAGLSAAINLARQGYEVTVYEKRPQIGGKEEFRPDPAGPPFNLSGLQAYTGLDISSVAHVPREFSYLIWGRETQVRMRPEVPLYLVERGSRSSSLDWFLWQLARDEGVEFHFNRDFTSREEFAALPPNSIIATGLEEIPFRLLDIPYLPSLGYYAKAIVEFPDPTATIYFDDYSLDYGFTCTLNGAAFGLLFSKAIPVTASGLHKFRDQVARHEKYEFKDWQPLTGVCPHASYSNPRLFWEDKILAGTLAGAMDPFMEFGMLGALVSGKIAALAVENRELALKEFIRLNKSYAPMLAVSRTLDALPHPARKSVYTAVWPLVNILPDWAVRTFYMFVPGYNRMG